MHPHGTLSRDKSETNRRRCHDHRLKGDVRATGTGKHDSFLAGHAPGPPKRQRPSTIPPRPGTVNRRRKVVRLGAGEGTERLLRPSIDTDPTHHSRRKRQGRPARFGEHGRRRDRHTAALTPGIEADQNDIGYRHRDAAGQLGSVKKSGLGHLAGDRHRMS